MSVKQVLPTVDQITKVVSSLFGGDTFVKKAATPIDLKSKTLVAKYADSGADVHRLVVCDLAFANNAGAALTMISPSAVADAMKASQVPDNILDNFREVMNIFVNLFPETSRGRLVLDGINLPNQAADEKTVNALAKPVERADFEITVPRYGAGRLTLLAC